MLSRITPATTVPLPATTYLLAVDEVIQDTQLGFAWSDALDLLWSGDYNAGAPRLLHIDLAAGTSADVTEEVLKHLAERTYVEQETPDHLAPLFHWHRIDAFEPAHPMALDPAALPSLSSALGRRRALFGAYEG